MNKRDILAALQIEAHTKTQAAMAPRSVKGAWTDEEMGMRPGGYPSRAAFLTESDEDTKMWGDTTSLTFTGPELVNITSPQLVHVKRKRPATFQTLVTINLGQGWTAEGSFTFAIAYIVGVGQAQTALVIPITIASPANGAQVFDARQLPVTALQIQVAMAGNSSISGPHDAQVTALVAPVTP